MDDNEQKCYNDVKTQDVKPYEELTFADDYMFCKILSEKPGLCKKLIELITGRKVARIVSLESQKRVEMTPTGRGVRFDVYFEGDDVIYDIEMQTTVPPAPEFGRRARYYQGMIDLNAISRGAKFAELKKSCIIFIMLHDPFDQGLSRYTFRNYCCENRDMILHDGAEKIFLNADGNGQDISPELNKFLSFVAGGKPESDFTKELDNLVQQNLSNEEWKVEYMTLEAKLQDREDIGSVKMLFQLVSDGDLSIDKALDNARPYGIKDKEDFRKKAGKAGYHINN